MDTLDENMLKGMQEQTPASKPSLFENIVEALSVPKNDALPTVNVIYIDMYHKRNGAGCHSFPALPDHTLSNRVLGGKNYKANINHTVDAHDVTLIPKTVAEYDDADFTLIDLDADLSANDIKQLERNILAQDVKTKVFFAAFKNDHTRKKQPFATENIPTVNYGALSAMAELNWDNIVANKQKSPGKTVAQQIADFFVSGWCYTCSCPGNDFRL